MTQSPFGGPPTELKLEVISEYLKSYKRVMSGAQAKARKNGWPVWKTMYVDAFAGSGIRPIAKTASPLLGEDQVDEFKSGSALRALEGEQHFDHYIFIEKSRKKIAELEQRISDHALADRCDFRCGDANDQLLELCEQIDWRNRRAVVFLDPFGNSVTWGAIEKLAKTGRVDLWYLFPSGNGVFRQISNDGKVTTESAASLDRLFGTTAWREEFLKEETDKNLFGKTVSVRKAVTPESATKFMIDRMETVFDGGVLPETLSLGDRQHGYPLYSLIFAWANPRKRAGEIASRIAKAIVKSKGNESGWLI